MRVLSGLNDSWIVADSDTIPIGYSAEGSALCDNSLLAGEQSKVDQPESAQAHGPDLSAMFLLARKDGGPVTAKWAWCVGSRNITLSR